MTLIMPSQCFEKGPEGKSVQVHINFHSIKPKNLNIWIWVLHVFSLDKTWSGIGLVDLLFDENITKKKNNDANKTF